MTAQEQETWERLVTFFTQIRVEYTWNGLTSAEALFVLGLVYGELAKVTAERDHLVADNADLKRQIDQQHHIALDVMRERDTLREEYDVRGGTRGHTGEARFWPTLDEDILRACARVFYERETGRDWHLAPTDPGLDPAWRARARTHSCC